MSDPKTIVFQATFTLHIAEIAEAPLGPVDHRIVVMAKDEENSQTIAYTSPSYHPRAETSHVEPILGGAMLYCAEMVARRALEMRDEKRREVPLPA